MLSLFRSAQREGLLSQASPDEVCAPDLLQQSGYQGDIHFGYQLVVTPFYIPLIICFKIISVDNESEFPTFVGFSLFCRI